MNEKDVVETIRTGKEIKEISSEIEKIQILLREGNHSDLQDELFRLNKKYRIETLFYNFMNPIPPKTVQENAQNCIKFLNALKDEKAIEEEKRLFEKLR